MKRGKQKGRGKSFRKAIAPWTYRQGLNRAGDKSLENRVRLVDNDPAKTSRECPQDGTVRQENRRGEKFRCVVCGYAADADYVGARNVLAKTLATLGSVESPRPPRAMMSSLK
jgi:transposase